MKKIISLIICFCMIGICLADTNLTCNLTAKEKRVFNLTNIERTKRKLPALKCNLVLQVLARDQSLWMSKHKDFAHDRMNGLTFKQRADLIRPKYKWMGIGENLAWGNFTDTGVVAGWMKSKGHRENILNTGFCEIGISFYNGYWTQVFGCTR